MRAGRHRPVLLAVLGMLLPLAGCGAGRGAGSPALSPSSPATTVPAPTSQSTAAPTVAPSPAPATLVPAGSWARVVSAGASPAAREDHTLTVAEDGTAYLFGGRDGATVFGDLWELDLASAAWRERTPSGHAPPGRFGHEAVWLPGRGLVVFAGQAGPDRFFADLWLYDPGTDAWTLLPASGSVPVARYGTCAGLGPDGRLWISHGFTEEGVRFADTHAYDFTTGSWSDESPLTNGPIQRCLHTCWWRSDGTFALYGGQTTGVPALGDLWTLTPGSGAGTNTWTEVGGDRPPPRNLPAVARHGQSTIILGGRGTEKTALADGWQLPDATGVFSPLAISGDVAPSARWGGALIDDPTRDGLVLFGGTDGVTADGDLWTLAWP
jgi:hypothetical protein